MVPVVPGIMCLNAYGGFCKMTNMCKTRVPADLQKRMDAVQNDKDAVKALGAEFGAEMSEGLLKGGAPGLHYYSLNLEVVVMGILERLGLKNKLESLVLNGKVD